MTPEPVADAEENPRRDDTRCAEHRDGKPGVPHKWRRGRRGHTVVVTCRPATPEPVADDRARTAPCQNCFLVVVERDGQWVHEETGDVFCRNRRATPNPPHLCGSRDGLSGCWHPVHGGNAWRAREVTP